MYQLDFVCMDRSDELLLDAQLHKMITSHMMKGDFNFAPVISTLTTSLFRFNLPRTNSAIAISYTLSKTLTKEQVDMLHETTIETPMDMAVINSIMCNIIQGLLRNDCPTWKSSIYRLEKVLNLTYTLEKVNELLGYELFDPEKIKDFRQFISDRKLQIFKFIDEEKENKKS